METLLAIIFIVFGLLQIILFFKLWGMTNDIRNIKEKYFNSDPSLTVGNLVKHKSTGKKMRIHSIKPSGKYACFLLDGRHEGDFDRQELDLLNK